MVTYLQVGTYPHVPNCIVNHPLSLAEDREKRSEARTKVQFEQLETQRRRSGGSFAPECRSWERYAAWQGRASTMAGHQLVGPGAGEARRSTHLRRAFAGPEVVIGHAYRSRHIAHFSHI